MASRAELIMAQVRGGLAQEYREKGPTKGEGIIEDLAAAALGYETATEAMYTLKGGVKDFYAEDRVQKRTERRLNRQDRRALRKETRAVNKAMDADFKSWEDDGSEDEIYNPEGRPGTRPDSAITYGPEQGVDTTPSSILPSEKIIEENLEAATGNLYLEGTLDTNYTNIGMFSTPFSESTKYKFDVNLDTINNQTGPPNVNYEAAGTTAWNTGRDMSDVATLRGRNNMDYLMDLDNGYPDVEPFTMSGTPYGPTQPLDNPGKPEVPLPTEEGASLLGNLSLTETSKDGTDITDMKSEGVPGLGGSYNTREYTDKKGKTMYETRFAQEYKKDGKNYYFATKPKQHGDESMSRRVNSTSLKDMELITKEEYNNFAGYSFAKPDKKKRRFKRRNK